jgi:hypothetical protein
MEKTFLLSFRKRWSKPLRNDTQFNQTTDLTLLEDECMDISKAISQLTIRGCRFTRCNQEFIDHIRFISSLTKITDLHIELNYFSIDILAQFLHLLPNLDSFTIVSNNSNQIIELTEEQINMIHAASNMNKITTMTIEQIIDLNQVEILINLCSRMEYLQIKCSEYTILESIIRLILMKRKPYLYSLCIWISEADDSMVKKLQTMIGFEKLLVNYAIQRLCDRIYLQWQRQ